MSGSLDAPILTMTQEPIQGGLIPLAKHQVSISSDAVRWESLSAPGRQVGTVAFCDLLGCSVAGTETASPKLVLHCFPKKTQKTAKTDLDTAARRFRAVKQERAK